MTTETTPVGAGESSPAPDCSALRYRCEGGEGCVKPGCEFIANGKTWNEHEKVYMCPFNHWRSCRWCLMPNAPALASDSQQQVVGTMDQTRKEGKYGKERAQSTEEAVGEVE